MKRLNLTGHPRDFDIWASYLQRQIMENWLIRFNWIWKNGKAATFLYWKDWNRMNILPRLLYLFLYSSLFGFQQPPSKMQKIPVFIWRWKTKQNKKTRIKFLHLTRSKAHGGLNLPHLKLGRKTTQGSWVVTK